jgi:hypothetical protein
MLIGFSFNAFPVDPFTCALELGIASMENVGVGCSVPEARYGSSMA